jgi:hypothetical protein
MIQGSVTIRKRRRALRSGLTFAELIVATTIMVIIASAVATLSMAVHSANTHCQGQTTAAQHARIALQRIQQAVEEAASSEQFPVCLVVAEQAGGQSLPDTLVVWCPQGAAANPGGLPLVRELVVFAPDPVRPSTLLEIRSPADGAVAPPPADTAAWQTLVEQLKTSQSSEKVALTDRLRTTPVTGTWNDSLTAAQLRGVIRFRRLMAPTAQEWAQYRAGDLDWDELAWPLDSFRATSGTRTVACQTEMQLVTGAKEAAANTALPFFGSVSFSYELQR